jgi:prophage regulatory protein
MIVSELTTTAKDYKMLNQSLNVDEILRLEEIKKLTKKSKSSIYADIASGLFPAPVKIGVRAVGWKTSQIANWLDSLQSTQEH